MKKNSFKLFNKGFTLIELLAVITILAFILMISVPRVLSMIEASEKESFKIVGENLIKATKQKVLDEMGDYGDGLKFIIEDGKFIGESITMTGKLPDNGTIYVAKDGEISIVLSNDKWCAKKIPGEKEIIVSKDPECILNVLETVPEWCFSITNNGTYVTINNYDNSCSKSPIIPDTLDGLPVQRIRYYAFYNRHLTAVSIPESVTYIDYMAFTKNRLTEVILPEGVTELTNGVFSYNNLRSAIIPSHVTKIKSNAFFSNQITNLSIPSTVTEIGSAAFNDNLLPEEQAFIYARGYYNGDIDNTTIVSYGGAKRDNVVIPNNIIEIGYEAFYSSSLTNITIPNSVEIIGSEAFYNNLLITLVIPNSVLEVNDGAFEQNLLTSVTIPSNIDIYGYGDYPAISNSFYFAYDVGGGKTGGIYTALCQECQWSREGHVASPTPAGCFTYAETATNVTITGYDGSCSSYVKIPETIAGKPVEHIGYRAFKASEMSPAYKDSPKYLLVYNNTKFKGNISLTNEEPVRIKYVEFPSTLKSIKEEAFLNNFDLNSVVIPNNVELIEKYAFGSTNIYNMYIPYGVTINDPIISNHDDISGYYNNYYNKEAGVYQRYECGWININSALPNPSVLCK